MDYTPSEFKLKYEMRNSQTKFSSTNMVAPGRSEKYDVQIAETNSRIPLTVIGKTLPSARLRCVTSIIIRGMVKR